MYTASIIAIEKENEVEDLCEATVPDLAYMLIYKTYRGMYRHKQMFFRLLMVTSEFSSSNVSCVLHLLFIY